MFVAYFMRVVYNYEAVLSRSMGKNFPADAGAGSNKKSPGKYIFLRGMLLMIDKERFSNVPELDAAKIRQTDDGSPAKALQAGANDFIVKPVAKVELLERIGKYI